MLTIFMFTPVAQVYSSYILPRDNYNIRIGDGNSQITNMEIIFNDPNIKKEVRPSEIGSPYTPITSTSGSGDIFDVYDKLLYQESVGLSLKFNKTMSGTTDFIGDNHSYVISDLGYNQEQIEYDITDVTAITDFYNVSSYTDESVHIQLGSSFPPSVTLIAQGFEVQWDRANFTSANLYLGRGLSASAD
ncbi:MAG: hypothetical protein H7641_05730, partial [Candidatus Heimdallarchaeota archaeon]|nr:hypothetical protein [Candidatus Heimdallarchaeota archaeon]MCK4877061.1 hypothetical protein [Candidatus Heimdallarchaeota archaeon]